MDCWKGLYSFQVWPFELLKVLFGRRYGVSRDDDKRQKCTWPENLHTEDHFRTEVPIKYMKNANLVPFAAMGERYGDDNDKSKDFKQFQANPRELQPTPLADGYFKLAPVGVVCSYVPNTSRSHHLITLWDLRLQYASLV